MRRWIQAGALLLVASAAGAETVVLEAVERGSFRQDGSWVLGPEAEYATGRGARGEERGVFVFDVSALGGAATSATLRVFSPADGTVGPGRVESVVVYAVSSDPALLVWEASISEARNSPEPARATFWDLGTGLALGSARVRAGRSGFVEVPLDAAILRGLDRSTGLVALGVRAASLRRPKREGPPLEERVFASTGAGAGVPRPQLVVSTEPGSDAAHPAAMLHVDAARGRLHGTGAARDPLKTLAAALDLAVPGDSVRVAPGRYAETVVMKDGVDVLGAGADRTVLDLSHLPSVRCADATLSGFFVWRGTSPGLSAEAVDCTNGASPTILESTVSAAFGAVLLAGSRAILRGNQIIGSIDGIESSPTLTENEIHGPLHSVYLAFEDSDPDPPFQIERNRLRGTVWVLCAVPSGNRIVGNHLVPSLGGQVLGATGAIAFDGSGELGLIASNTFFGTGGVVFGGRPRPFGVPACNGAKSATIANNVLAFGDGGISLDSLSTAAIVHNDVFENRRPLLSPSGENRNYVGLLDLTGVNGNISEDPQFSGSGYETAGLAAGSPALDAGANELAASDVDLDGNPRIVDATDLGEPRIDIGAVELRPVADPPRSVAVSVEARYRVGAFGLGDGLAPGRPFRVAVLSDAELDAPGEVDATTLAVEGAAPRGRCRVRDVDDDGDDDLLCRFPFAALESLPRFATKRVCVSGALLADGAPIRGCDRVNVLLLPRATVR